MNSMFPLENVTSYLLLCSHPKYQWQINYVFLNIRLTPFQTNDTTVFTPLNVRLVVSSSKGSPGSGMYQYECCRPFCTVHHREDRYYES